MLTNAEFALLSLLAEAPLHGYGLERLIEARGMRQWTALGFSSIYFLLKKLASRGLVALERPAGTGPRVRRVYSLTEAGARAHREEARRALAEPDTLHPSILLGLANWPALPPRQARAALDERAAALVHRLAELDGRRAAQQPLPPFVAAMFDYSAAMIAAERAWLDNARDQLTEGHGGQD